MQQVKNIPKIGISSLVVDNYLNPTKLLLIKRESGAYKDKWSLPGGHLEYGERLEQAMLRELKEETGYTAFSLNNKYNIEELLLKNVDSQTTHHYIIMTGTFWVKDFQIYDKNHEQIIRQIVQIDKKEQNNKSLPLLQDIQEQNCTPNLINIIQKILCEQFPQKYNLKMFEK